MLTVEDLPFDVLTKIFRYLNSFDGQNVRLTCKRWYTVYSESLFVKFVLKGDNLNFNSIIELVTRSGFEHLNLEFVETEFRSKSTVNSFWDECGHRIKSLCLDHCKLSEGDLKEIITKCENIKYLSLKNCDVPFKVHLTIDVLLTNAIHIESLISLEFDYCEWITNDVFDKFCILYPSIRNIRLHHLSSQFTYDSVINKIRASAEIFECLDLNENINELEDKELSDIASIPDLKLKQLCIDHQKITYEGFKTLFLKQARLQYLDMSNAFGFTPESIQELLKHCSNLHSLKIQCSNQYFYEILELIGTSHLKSFQIRPLNEADVSSVPLSDTQLVNYRLNRLRIVDFYMYEKGYLWIIKRFRRLQCIGRSTLGDQYYVSDAQLEAITYQTKLKKLEIDVQPFTLIGYDSFEMLSKLKDLQYLELHECDIMSFDQLVFPQLKHLTVAYLSKIFGTVSKNRVIPVFCKNNPTIEYFNIVDHNIESEEVDSIVMYLPKLRKLHIQCFLPGDAKIPFDFDNSSVINHPGLREAIVEKYNMKDSSEGASMIYEIYRYTCSYNIFMKKWKKESDVREQEFWLSCHPPRVESFAF